MNHNVPTNEIRAVPAGISLRRCGRTALIVLTLAAAVSVAIKLDVSPMLSALRDEASASRVTVWALLLLYTVLLVMPFVPGAEIGLALLLVFGAAMAWPVYAATVLALSIAFAVGRLASRSRSPASFGNVPLASDAVTSLLEGLRNRPWIHGLMRFRWLALALLINMPGNTVIGGGGGIAMAVGYSRTFTYPAFLACVAFAVAPVPALVLLAEVTGFGERLSQWLRHFV
ncbi:hypothetical protein MWU52_04205 [Jannaschia sp. S6380]|uniref:hypothetical protein n=1 Tax=Jannaschia sp. S6380 TaxID=2926408 RepID=UPI001FF17387|nr:hypothetical protein [Jannaschia sp. S6380]MCK0166747.1 hypothetical protein [Jannaschia sp. S6380]